MFWNVTEKTVSFRFRPSGSEWLEKLKIRWWQHRVGSTPTTGTTGPECESIRDFLFAIHFPVPPEV